MREPEIAFENGVVSGPDYHRRFYSVDIHRRLSCSARGGGARRGENGKGIGGCSVDTQAVEEFRSSRDGDGRQDADDGYGDHDVEHGECGASRAL